MRQSTEGGRYSVSLIVLLLAGVVLALPAEAEAQDWSLASAADSALTHHPALARADADLDGALAGTDAARAARLPSISGGATVTRFEEPMIVAPLHAFDLTQPPRFDPTLVQGQAEVRYTIFDGGGRGARIRAAEAGADATGDRRTMAHMDVLQAVVAGYTGVLGARSVLEAADRQVAALETELDRARRRFDEGTVAPVDVMRAEAAVLDARAARTSADAEVLVSERHLARTMGVEPGLVVGASLREVAVAAPMALSDTTRASLDASPLVLAATNEVRAADARVAVERSQRLPSLDASAGLLTFGSADGDFVTEWQTGFRLSWPVFTGGARSASIDRAEAGRRAAEAERDRVRLRIADARDGALAAAEAAAARREALAASVEQWREVARVEALALEEGSGVQQDYLAAQAAVFRVQAELARARYDEVLAHLAAAQADGTLDREWIDEALEAAP